MRNGDAYYIQGQAKQGVSDSDICGNPRLRAYSTEEIMRFIPQKAQAVPVSVVDEALLPPPKKKARRRSTAKG